MVQTSVGSAAAEGVARLYAEHARSLRRIVRANIRAPEAVIDDACQIAWSRLIPRAAGVGYDTALPWLVTTASREAVRLLRRTDHEVSLEMLLDEGAALPAASGPDEVVGLRDRLRSVSALPVRQQQLVWLAGLGFSYEEMADRTGATRRTVERQLLRAKHTLKAVA